MPANKHWVHWVTGWVGAVPGCLPDGFEAFEAWDEMPKFPALFDVRPVGPPLLLSFGCWISLSAGVPGPHEPPDPRAVSGASL